MADIPMLTGPFSHDLMVCVMEDQYPDLKHGPDYRVAHPIDPDRPGEHGDPFFIQWTNKDVEQPDPADIKALFEANEEKYRATFARKFRNACLVGTDGRANVADAPPSTRLSAQVDAWRTYRQALRDVPQQPGFPLVIDWPEYPGE